MKVFYDSTIFSRQTIGGISRYFVELINRLPDTVTPVLGVKASENMYLNDLRMPCRHLSLRHVPDHPQLTASVYESVLRQV